jgi:hypothetical protein
MLALVALTGVFILSAAPQAHADPNNFGCLPGPNNCAYISALQRDGIDTATPVDVFEVGHGICRLPYHGHTVDQLVAGMRANAPDIQYWWASTVVRDAHDYLCPTQGR